MSTRSALRRDMATAITAQQTRAEDYSRGHAEETAAFYGSDSTAAAGRTERRLTLAAADKEARAKAQHDREQARAHRERRARGYGGMTPAAVMDEVLAHSGDHWKALGMAAIAELAATGRRFQAYDLVVAGLPEPNHPNRWGALFHAAREAGLVTPSSVAPSKRPTVRNSICRMWRGAHTTRNVA